MTTGGLLLAAGWMLVGTLVTDTRSVAIVESESGAQQVLREGDPLEACVVGAIARDEITLSCVTGELRLSLESSHRPRSSRQAMGPHDTQVFSLPAENFRALLRDRQKLSSHISLEPAVVQGFVHGYRVASIEASGDLAGFGIAPGDVITHVNGAPARQSGTFIQTIDALAQQTAFSLDIERDGERLALHYLLLHRLP